jgi:hypothetical protein
MVLVLYIARSDEMGFCDILPRRPYFMYISTLLTRKHALPSQCIELAVTCSPVHHQVCCVFCQYAQHGLVRGRQLLGVGNALRVLPRARDPWESKVWRIGRIIEKQLVIAYFVVLRHPAAEIVCFKTPPVSLLMIGAKLDARGLNQYEYC